jgi:hypothetical protein
MNQYEPNPNFVAKPKSEPSVSPEVESHILSLQQRTNNLYSIVELQARQIRRLESSLQTIEARLASRS